MQASCGIGLYYSNGYDTRMENLGRTDGDSLGECDFDVNEPVISGMHACMHESLLKG